MLDKSKIAEIKNREHKGKNCSLKKLLVINCNNNYLSWIRDKKINKFLESRFQKINKKKLIEFVKNSNKDYSTVLYGIFYKKLHIGNIKISINWHHNYATLGYLVGNHNYQGKNIGSESIRICTNICFKYLKLRFCLASIYSNNIASFKVLKKNGFNLISKIKKIYKIKKNDYTDELTFRLDNPNSKN